MQERALYRKRGRKYELVGYDFTGFPEDGVWLVADGRQSLIMKVGDLNDPVPLAALSRYRDLAANAVSEVIAGNPGRRISALELVDIAFKCVCQAAEQEPQEQPLSTEEVRRLRGMMARQSIKGPSKPTWEDEQRRVQEETYRKLAQAGYAKCEKLNGHEC
ncbi:MAG TPA: hypothetical protein VFJ52_10650 [Terriglobia bacterium]|nr:hypothetical protein [Terriglobia bacterium]